MDKRLWRAATLFFGLTAVFTLLLSAPVRVLLLRPLLYLGWLIAQQPQSTVWAGAGTVGFLVAFYSWRRALPKRLPHPPAHQEEVFSPPDLEQLTQLIQRAQLSPVSQARLAQRLARLAITLRVQTEALSPQRAREEFRSGRWPQNPHLRAALAPKPNLRGRRYLENLSRALSALEGYSQGGVR